MPPRGDVRPRAYCPWCQRSTSVTFDARNGDAFLRSHNSEAARTMHGKRVKCVGSRAKVPSRLVFQP